MIENTWNDDSLRGDRTARHGRGTGHRPIRMGWMVIAALAVAVAGMQLWRTTSGYDAYAVAMLTLAEASLAIGYQPDAGLAVRIQNEDTVVASIADIAAYGPWQARREAVLETVLSGAWLGSKIGLVIAVAMLAWFRWRGRRRDRRHPPSGAELVTAGRLRRRVDPWRVRALRLLAGETVPYRIAGVPYPGFAETRHTLVSGIGGSGKGVLISDLVRRIRARGDRCLIYDRAGLYTQAFFDPARDVLLNPFDARMPRWSPFFEARAPRDFDAMAEALIPQRSESVDPVSENAARQYFSNCAVALWRQGETGNRALVEQLLKMNPPDLARAMEGAACWSFADPKSPKTALGVRAMLTAGMGAMEELPDTGAAFSIRRWIVDDRDDGFLFLASPGDRHARLRGLISLWLEIAVDALLTLEPDECRRLWVIVDDVATLNAVPSLRAGLAGSGALGGCFVLGVQAVSALREVYGKDGAEALSSLCGTRVVLAAPDVDTAAWAAEGLGCRGAGDLTIGVSLGVGPHRDGVALTAGGAPRPVVATSQIMRLANLNGYLRFPGPCPVARFGLRDERRPYVAPRFVARAHRGAEAANPASAIPGTRH